MSEETRSSVPDKTTRALEWGKDPEEETPSPEFQRSLAVVIGINDYQQVKPLHTAAHDARCLAEILAQHHYQVLLLTENVTLVRLKNLLSTELPSENLGGNDRVLFYFAGHGVALDGQAGPEGYLIPQDADPAQPDTFLPMTDLHKALSALNCRHMLVVLDCCFAGAFKWGATRDVPLLPPKIYRQQYQRFTRDPAWQVITSAAHDQKALDTISGQVIGARDNADGHSPFAEALFKALQGAGDIVPPDGDGLITATELYFYLRYQVEPETEEKAIRQTPGIWFLPKHDKGEYVFLQPNGKLKLEEDPILDEKNSPYRGLTPFEEADQPFFFGRDEVIKDLAAVVSGQLLTVVLGVSGTGKSSLVKAGLIPYLKNAKILEQHGPTHSDPAASTAPDGGQSWQILPPIRPTKHPLRQLELALQDHPSFAGLKTNTTDWVKDPETLTRLATAWTEANPDHRLLVVIDQFEELVTVCESAIERDQFLALLANLVQANPERVHVALTLRSDFEPRFTNMLVNQPSGPVIAKETWNKARFLVRAMTPSELRQAIEGPALAKVLYFDSPRLVDDLINEVSQTPSPLPLLSFTLNEMYLRYVKRQADGLASDRTMTRADYEALGGVAGSLQQRANKEYEQLKQNPAAQETMRRVMLRMLAVEGGETARRRVPKSELKYADEDENDRVKTVLTNLERARLVVNGEMEAEPYVEPAHDTLIQAWEQLANWRAAEGDHLLLQRRVTQAAAEWARTGQTQGLWDDDPRLPQVEQILEGQEKQSPLSLPQPAPAVEAPAGRPRSGENWLVRNIKQVIRAFKNEAIQLADKYWLNRLELEFVRASVAQRHRDLRRLVLTVAGVMGVLAALAIFAFIQQGIANEQRSVADEQRVIAEAAQVTAVSEANTRATAQADTEIQRVTAVAAQVTAVSEANTRATAQALEAAAAATAEARRIEAERQTTLSLSRQLAAQSVSERLNGRLDLALLLGVAATTITDTIETHDSLLNGLQYNSPRLRHYLTGHSDYVMSVAFSPDGKILASGSDDGTIMLWDVNRPDSPPVRLDPSLTGHKGYNILSMAFSPKGKILASGGGNGILTLWDVSQPAAPIRLRQLPTKHSGYILSVAFSPDGQTLASGGDNGILVLWDVNQPAAPVPLPGHNGDVTSVAFSSDKILASGDISGIIRLWDVSRPAAPVPFDPPLAGHSDDVGDIVAFSPNGKILASGDMTGTIRLWDVSRPAAPVRLGQPLTGHSDGIESMAFSPDGQTLASGSDDKTIILWDVSQSAAPVPLGPPLIGHSGRVLNIAFSPDGQTLASGGLDKTAILWNTSRPPADVFLNQLLTGYTPPEYSGHGAVFSPDGKIMASSGGGDNTIILWDVSQPATPTLLSQLLTSDNSYVESLAFSPDGRTLASGSGDNHTIILWDVSQPDSPVPLGQPLTGHSDDVMSLAFSPDGQTLASIDSSGILFLWDVSQPAAPIRLDPSLRIDSRTNQTRVVFSPAGRILASNGGTIILWDVSRPAAPVPLGPPLSYTKLVISMAFSLDGQTLAASGLDGTIILWDVSQPAAPVPLDQLLTGHDSRDRFGDRVVSMAFSPDGRNLVSCDDSTIRLWDVSQPAAPIRLGQPLTVDSYLDRITFSPDGRILASGGYNILLWDMSRESWQVRACRIANRNLTQAEWRRYVGETPYQKMCLHLPVEE